ncbi:unnamed protein product [Sphagnum troendelagicum]|uniref:Uncharacterized protein n=1 Tax=Sphagnum troendelagicum TaxID=128251 RepID=A0ABP0UR07_9BRYO
MGHGILQNYQLLNCEDHATFLKKHKRDPALYHPDILHQALLAILDSTLNKLLQKLSIRASNGPDKLMRIVKQPMTRYLPLGARHISKYAQVNALVTIMYFSSK